jgi:hypothetical protein
MSKFRHSDVNFVELVNRIAKALTDVLDANFWGEITIKFREGIPTKIDITRSQNLD